MIYFALMAGHYPPFLTPPPPDPYKNISTVLAIGLQGFPTVASDEHCLVFQSPQLSRLLVI